MSEMMTAVALDGFPSEPEATGSSSQLLQVNIYRYELFHFAVFISRYCEMIQILAIIRVIIFYQLLESL